MANLDPAMLVALGAMGVALIGAIAAGVVSIIKATGEMRAGLKTVASKVAEVHSVVNGSAEKLKDQNERAALTLKEEAARATTEAIRIANEKAAEAYAKGVAEGKLTAFREAGVIKPEIPVVKETPVL